MRKRTCLAAAPGCKALIAPNASTWRVRPAARYVTSALPLPRTASWIFDALRSTSSEADAAAGVSAARSSVNVSARTAIETPPEVRSVAFLRPARTLRAQIERPAVPALGAQVRGRVQRVRGPGLLRDP